MIIRTVRTALLQHCHGVGSAGLLCAENHQMALEGLEFLGVELDKEVNNKMRGEEAILSTPESKVKVLLIPTDEEMMIATDTYEIVKGLN